MSRTLLSPIVASLRPLARPILQPSPSTSRTLFGLPSFPFAPPTAHPGRGVLTKRGSTSIYSESEVMPYTPQELYAVIADVDAYSSFLPFVKISRVLDAKKGKEIHRVGEKGWLHKEGAEEMWDLEAELKIGAMGYEEGYVSKVQSKKWEYVSATAKDTTIFAHLLTRWTLSPLPPTSAQGPRTKVDLKLEYRFVSPLHAMTVGAVWEKVSGMMVGGFEKRVKEVYGKRM